MKLDEAIGQNFCGLLLGFNILIVILENEKIFLKGVICMGLHCDRRNFMRDIFYDIGK